MTHAFSHCVHCNSTNFIKAGLKEGRQRYKCKDCNRCFSVHQHSGHIPVETKNKAVRMYMEGLGYRSIGRVLDVSHVSVYYWVKEAMQKYSPEVDKNLEAEVVEIDEIYSFFIKRKQTLDMDSNLPIY